MKTFGTVSANHITQSSIDHKKHKFQFLIEIILVLWIIVGLCAWWSIKISGSFKPKYIPLQIRTITREFNNWVEPVVYRKSIYQR